MTSPHGFSANGPRRALPTELVRPGLLPNCRTRAAFSRELRVSLALEGIANNCTAFKTRSSGAYRQVETFPQPAAGRFRQETSAEILEWGRLAPRNRRDSFQRRGFHREICEIQFDHLLHAGLSV